MWFRTRKGLRFGATPIRGGRVFARGPARAIAVAGIAMLWSGNVAGNPFRELLNEQTYEDEKARMKQSFEQTAKLSVAGMPLTGAEVFAVRPDTPAANAGLRSGDVIYRIENQVLWGESLWSRRSKRDQQFYSISLDRGKNTFWLPPGPTGIVHRPYNRIDLAYLKLRGNRSPKWDKDVVLACLKWQSDAALAETAWHRAINSGYSPDVLSAYFAAVFKMQQPGGAEAETSEFLAYFKSAGVVPNMFVQGLLPLLSANGRVADLSDSVTQRSPHFPWTADDIVRLQDWQKSGAAFAGSLLDVKKKDISAELQHLSGDLSGMPYVAAATTRVAPGSLQSESFGLARPLKNTHLQMRLKLRTSGDHAAIPSALRLSVVKRDQSAAKRPVRYPAVRPYHDIRMVSAAFLAGGNDGRHDRLSMSSSGLEATWSAWSRDAEVLAEYDVHARLELDRPDAHLGGDHEFVTLDLVRLENEVAVYLNGACYLRLPADASVDDVAFDLQRSGVVCEKVELKAFELLP